MVLMYDYSPRDKILKYFGLDKDTPHTKKIRTQMVNSSAHMQLDKPFRVRDIEMGYFVSEIYGRAVWYRKRWAQLGY